MPKKKSETSGKPAAQPRAAAPNKASKRKAPTKRSPRKGQRRKEQAVEASSSNESDGDAPAPAPAATAEPTKKCSGKCKKKLPQSAYSQTQWNKGKDERKCDNCKGSHVKQRKPARSNQEDVTLLAKIITPKDEEKDSVPVPGDEQQRSVRVQHVVRITRREPETPDDKIKRATDRWLDAGGRGGGNPQKRWSVMDAATGVRLGACAMPITVSVDRTNRRAVVTEGTLMETLQKQQMGAISMRTFRPDYGNNSSRFLTRNAEKGLVLLLKTYRDSVAAVRERKCNGTALASDKGVVVEATQGCFPSDLTRLVPDVDRAVCILRSTVKTRGGRQPHFVAGTMKDAQAKCLRQVSTSAWKCAFNLTRLATPSTRLLDGVCSMAWTRDSPFDVPRRTKRA